MAAVEYIKYMKTDVRGLWQLMDAEQVYDFQDHVCRYCKEMGCANGKNLTNRSCRQCDYVARHGECRRCSPLSCVELGIFRPLSPKIDMSSINRYVDKLIRTLKEKETGN